MKKSLLEIYALAVCFFTVACLVVVLGMAMWDGIQVATPDFTMYSANWIKHQTDDAFREALIAEHRYRDEKSTYTPPTGADLTRAREESYARALLAERRDGFRELVRSLIILVIDMLVFLMHWKIAAGARRNAGQAG